MPDLRFKQHFRIFTWAPGMSCTPGDIDTTNQRETDLNSVLCGSRTDTFCPFIYSTWNGGQNPRFEMTEAQCYPKFLAC